MVMFPHSLYYSAIFAMKLARPLHHVVVECAIEILSI